MGSTAFAGLSIPVEQCAILVCKFGGSFAEILKNFVGLGIMIWAGGRSARVAPHVNYRRLPAGLQAVPPV